MLHKKIREQRINLEADISQAHRSTQRWAEAGAKNMHTQAYSKNISTTHKQGLLECERRVEGKSLKLHGNALE